MLGAALGLAWRATLPLCLAGFGLACSGEGYGRRASSDPATTAASAGGERGAPAAAPASALADTFAGVGPFGAEARYLANIRQLTFEGQNAEAYWSPDDAWITFQATPDSLACDQVFVMRPDGSGKRMVSTGRGVTTCSYFLYPEGERILFSSTHLAGPACPPRPSYERGYVWPVHEGYDVFTVRSDGGDLRRLTEAPGYDAEATLSRDGSKIVFTSARDGDLEIYTMDKDGGNVRRLTHEPGYDGGAFFSYDGSRIVYRAHHPEDPAELANDRDLLSRGLVRPTRMEIRVMDADGSDKRQVTDNGAANFAPYFFPDGRRILFASNMDDPQGRGFDLYAVGVDGTGLERITTHPDFDAFPMFNADGTKLLWASNRNAARPRETNVFVADWVGPRP